MKKTLALILMLAILTGSFAQKSGIKEFPVSFVSNKERLRMIRSIWTIPIEEIELREHVYDRISGATGVIRIGHGYIENADSVDFDKDLYSQLTFGASSTYLYNLVGRDSIDVIADFDLPASVDGEVWVDFQSFFGTDEASELFSILNLIDKLKWKKDKTSIITLSDYKGFFVIYNSETYILRNNNLQKAHTYLPEIIDKVTPHGFKTKYLFENAFDRIARDRQKK